MTFAPLIVGDDVTVLLGGKFLARVRVRSIKGDEVEVWPGDYRLQLDDEGTLWVRGFHDAEDAEALLALLAANALSDTNTQQGESS